MKIFNTLDKDIIIIDVQSNISNKTEIHTHNILNGMMKMYRIERLTISKSSIIELKSMSYHIMFIGLKKPLVINDVVNLKLILSNKEEIDLKIPVIKNNHKIPIKTSTFF